WPGWWIGFCRRIGCRSNDESRRPRLELAVLDAVLGVFHRPAQRLDLVARLVGGLEVLALAGLQARGREGDHLVGRLLLGDCPEDPEDFAEALEEVERLRGPRPAQAWADGLVALFPKGLGEPDGAGAGETV